MAVFSKLRIEGFSDHHVQGIAIDKKHEFMYFSFTTSLIKTDLRGNILGSVTGIIGHLGCIALNPDDGRIYASLEYNNDAIGRGILKSLDKDIVFPDLFYVAAFDVDKIVRLNMDAEKDGIMTAVLVKEACDDYSAKGHRFGCSGIDGITFAPKPGTMNNDLFLYVAYGIYKDNKRRDNDHQILLMYDIKDFCRYEAALNQNDLHMNGPETPFGKYFVFTGNTNYGIQNLEYDSERYCLFAAVYPGKKWYYPNYSMFAIDLCENAVNIKLHGLDTKGDTLKLKKLGFFKKRGKISGSYFNYGSTGMISLGNSRFIFSEEFKDKNGHGTEACAYILNDDTGFIRSEIEL